MNLPMTYLENMIRNPSKLSKLILNHMANKTLFKAGLKSHQQVQMANGNILNLYARPGKLQAFLAFFNYLKTNISNFRAGS